MWLLHIEKRVPCKRYCIKLNKLYFKNGSYWRADKSLAPTVEGNKLQRPRLTTLYQTLRHTNNITTYCCCLYAVSLGTGLQVLVAVACFLPGSGLRTYQHPCKKTPVEVGVLGWWQGATCSCGHNWGDRPIWRVFWYKWYMFYSTYGIEYVMLLKCVYVSCDIFCNLRGTYT